MRIDAYNQISQLYRSTNVTKTQKTSAIKETDQVQISRTGQDYQVAKQAVAQSPDVRDDVVASLKSSIEAGTYEVNDGDFASKLLEKYNEISR